MFYSASGLLVITVAVVVALFALWLIVRKSWFVVWLKASLAFVFIACAVLIILVGADLFRYQSFRHEVPVAKLQVMRLEPQLYAVTLEVIDGDSHQFQLRGDMWQLDARLITWDGPFVTFIGATPGYRFDRISGRYRSLEQEINAERTVYGISESISPFDFFQWLQDNQVLPWVDAKYGSGTFLPLAHGAEFAIAVGIDGLIARPVNSNAIAAVSAWQ